MSNTKKKSRVVAITGSSTRSVMFSQSSLLLYAELLNNVQLAAAHEGFEQQAQTVIRAKQELAAALTKISDQVEEPTLPEA